MPKESGGQINPDVLVTQNHSAVEDYSKEFDAALAKLNSDNSTIAKEGLDLMRGLADKQYPDAQKELGLTYCPFSKIQSSAIKDRREILGLSKDISVSQSIQYLESIMTTETMSVDVLYTLGYSYWRQHNWSKGSETLSKALEKLLSSSETTFNGKSKDELQKDIKRYLNECEKQLRK